MICHLVTRVLISFEPRRYTVLFTQTDPQEELEMKSPRKILEII